MIARCVAVLTLLLACLPARAQVEVDAALDGQRVDEEATYWFDPTGAASLAEVRAHDAAFRSPGRAGLHFGLEYAGACWLRIPVRNRGDAPRTWMLEVGYPHLDEVTLYLPGAGGSERLDTGDMRPFGSRPYRHHNFVFRIEEAAHSERVLYMRVATHAILYVPLRGWEERRFAEHHYLEWTLLFGFYGVVVIMAAYNLLLFALTRLREYGLFALVVLAEGFTSFVGSGHAFQVLEQVDLAQRLVPFSLNLAIFANCLFAGHRVYELLPIWLHRTAKVLAPITLLCTLLTLVVPFAVTKYLVWFCYLLLMPFAGLVALSWRLSKRAGDLASTAWANALAAGWLAVIVGGSLTFATPNGVFPPNRWTNWGFSLGATLQFVLITAALASRVRWLQQELGTVNDALQRKVSELGAAIDLTQTETARAEAAAHAKNEVIATMTHELRTPLNAIINIPEGLVERFCESEGARCRACQATFLLEPGERLEPDAACPDCGAAAALAPESFVAHVGDPAKSLRYLEIVEKAGRHLLQVINGILDASPENRGLDAVTLDVVPLLEEVVEQVGAVAARSDVRLSLSLAQPALLLTVDPLRFRQIVINLVGNAIKFSHPGGEVTVSARVDGAHAVFSVEDRGIGIPEAKRATVFESFEQAHDPAQRRFQGTGLGLSIVRSLVRLHDGEIWLESEVGRGTTFHFSMPVRREAAA